MNQLKIRPHYLDRIYQKLKILPALARMSLSAF
jgi:hypothetical protein